MKLKNTNGKNFLSKTIIIIKNPFFIIGIILLISIISYFIITKNQSKPIPTVSCDLNTQSLCGGICIDNNSERCTDDGEKCKLSKYCPNQFKER